MIHAYFSFDNSFIWKVLTVTDYKEVASFCRTLHWPRGTSYLTLNQLSKTESNMAIGMTAPLSWIPSLTNPHIGK